MTLPDGSDDDERRRWVEIVRAEVEAGTYHVDSRIVAERLIERGVIDAGDEQ
jgi:anti-sigma28 factor (negative regulator of flagellin synthesis)